MLDNNEIKSLISALGYGISDDFTVEKLRYTALCIMRCRRRWQSHPQLLLTFFFRHMRPMIDGGQLYIAQPPTTAQKRKDIETFITRPVWRHEVLPRVAKYKNPDRMRTAL